MYHETHEQHESQYFLLFVYFRVVRGLCSPFKTGQKGAITVIGRVRLRTKTPLASPAPFTITQSNHHKTRNAKRCASTPYP
jgi:hypothetical protein